MTPAQFNQWLADMQSAGLIRTDYGMTRDAANLLGMTVQNVNRLMRDGTRTTQTDLACSALLRGLGPYPHGEKQ